MSWTKLENVIYHIPKNFKYNSNIAIFNFVNTLVKIKDTNESKFEFLFENVPEMLIQLHQKKASIIVYQSFSHNNIEFIEMLFFEFLNKLNSIYFNQNKINNESNSNESNINESNSNESNSNEYKIPVIAFFSIKNNNFSKPCTGIWKMINLLYMKKNKEIDATKCISVGNLAGRIKSDNTKKDYNVSDRAFANNIQIKFTTPENFFSNKKKIH